MFEIAILINYSLKSLGVLKNDFRGFGCPAGKDYALPSAIVIAKYYYMPNLKQSHWHLIP